MANTVIFAGQSSVVFPPNIVRPVPDAAHPYVFNVTRNGILVAAGTSGQTINGWKIDFAGVNDEDLTVSQVPLGKIHILPPANAPLSNAGNAYEVTGGYFASDGVTNGIAFSLVAVPSPRSLTATVVY